VKKKKPKSIAKLKKELWKIFSIYIRTRDAIRTTGDTEYIACITCGVWSKFKQTDAGHFIPRTCSYLLFCETNNHGQCKKCNLFKAGEQYLYSQAILRLYGKEELERLIEGKNKTKKFTRKELEGLKMLYRQKTENLLK